MIIRRGSALKEHAKAVITETRFTKKGLVDDKILLLEGPDDIEVISNFYLYKGQERKDLRLIKANESSTDDSIAIAGKQNALKLFAKLRQESRNVICLLDRDYDFFLGESITDSRIKYYDYFELENYVFEEAVFKIILKNVCDYPDYDSYKKIIGLLQKIEDACKPYILLCFLREVNYRKNVLTETQLKKILEIIKKRPESMMQMQNLNIGDSMERISGYIQKELVKVNLTIEKVQEIINSHEYITSSIVDVSEPLSLFRYAIKGKMISNSLPFFFKYILEMNPELNEIKSDGNLSSIIPRLKIEWIPNLSKDFAMLITKIEEEFDSVTANKYLNNPI